MEEIIAYFKQVVIQIATPYSKGTGFYLKQYHLIVTNEHVVRGNKEVVIQSNLLERQLAKVIFLDQKHDLAFLYIKSETDIPEVTIAHQREVVNGERIIAVGHPFGLKYANTQGNISNAFHQQNGINYYQHDAALNPGNSGSPLLDGKGHVIGVNTFVIQNGENVGFSLPAQYLKNALEEFQIREKETATRRMITAPLVVLK